MWDWGHSQFFLTFPSCKRQQKTSGDRPHCGCGMCPNDADFFASFTLGACTCRREEEKELRKKKKKKKSSKVGVVWCGVFALLVWFYLSVNFSFTRVFNVVILDSREEAGFGVMISVYPVGHVSQQQQTNQKISFSEKMSVRLGWVQYFCTVVACTEFTCILSRLYPGITCMAE